MATSLGRLVFQSWLAGSAETEGGNVHEEEQRHLLATGQIDEERSVKQGKIMSPFMLSHSEKKLLSNYTILDHIEIFYKGLVGHLEFGTILETLEKSSGQLLTRRR